MKSYLFGAVSVISLLAAGSASAHDDDGWYLRANAGYGIHEDVELSGGIDSSFHGNGLQSEGDDGFSLGVGYDFGNWRIEADGDTLNTSLGSISQTPNSTASLTTESIMLNALYDFEDFGRFEPFVGGGIGFVRTKANLAAHDFPSVDNVLTRNPVCVGPRTGVFDASTCEINDEDTGFGWQLLAGMGYKLTDNLTWDTHYTYLNAPESDLDGFITNNATADFSEISAELSDVAAHTVMTGLRYTFGHDHAPQVVEKLPPPPPPPTKICWDNSEILASAACPERVAIAPPPPPPPPPPPQPETFLCSDNQTVVFDLTTCPVPAPVEQTFLCSDNQTVVTDLANCPVQRANLNLCSESSVAIFNVPQSATPKQVSRLGTMPEFGNSHGLTPDQFYQKLDAAYNSNATDKAYLNYLFKSMGYSNGWADAQSYMFSEDVLPVGTRGLLGLGKVHHYEYSILPADEKDRQAFRIQSANGSVVHFMKTCGNYMYACE